MSASAPGGRDPGAGRTSAQPSPPAAGEAAAGAAFDPLALPADETDAEATRARGAPRAIPSPGSPLDDEALERLKRAAATSPPSSPPGVRGQADPASPAEGGTDAP